MPELEEETHFYPLRPDDPHYAAIGRVASAWAYFEFRVSQLIWILAGTDDERGACLTAQIFNIQSRLKALMALIRLSERPDAERLAKKVNKLLTDEIEPLSQKRNRIVHDPWMRGKTTGAIAQIIVVADRKLDFRFRPARLEDADKTWREIQRLDGKFQMLATEIRVALGSAKEERLEPPTAAPLE